MRQERGWRAFCAALNIMSLAAGLLLAVGTTAAKAQLIVDAGGRVLGFDPTTSIYTGPHYYPPPYQTEPTPTELLYGIGPSGFAWNVTTQKLVPIWDSNSADPFIDSTVINDTGIRATSSATGAVGPAISSRTTDVGGGADGSFPLFTKTFSPGVGQTLTIGGLVRYDSIWTNFNDGAFTAVPQSARQNIYTVSGNARYQVGNTYVAGVLSGDWGSGNVSGSVTTGHFSDQGGAGSVSIGHIFSPFAASLPSASAPMPTKASPAQIGGLLSALQLDVSVDVGYASDTVNAFTDAGGFAWGDERLKFWNAGAQARLFEVFVDRDYIITPFVAASVESQFDFSHTLGIPSQPAFGITSDTLLLGSAQTFWTEKTGIDVTDPNGWQYSLRGFYSESSEYRVYGFQAGFHMPIARWFGQTQTASR